MRYYRKLVFLWIYTPEFQLSHFLLSHQGKNVDTGFSRAKIKVSVQSFCAMLGHSLRHQAILNCIPRCSPFVHYMWDPHGHEPYGRMQESWERTKRAQTALAEVICIPKLPQACNGTAYSSQWLLFPGLIDSKHPTSLCMSQFFPFSSPFPQQSTWNGLVVPLGSVKLQLSGEAVQTTYNV